MKANTFYIDPIVVASSYNIKVYGDISSPPRLAKGESGMIVMEEGNITIYVSPNDTLEKQRFSIAHALGHFKHGHLSEDKTIFRDGHIGYSKDNYDLQELEANDYATKLLMPKEKIDFLIENKGCTRVEDIASALIVSYTNMSNRLEQIGWFG